MKKLKIGDWVKIISGQDKNKIIKITEIKKNNIIINNANLNKNSKKKLDISNVMYYSWDSNTTSKIGFKKENGKKCRYLKKNSNVLIE